ncbi:MAG: biosynthetic-type acetolactate synthase large subunit [Armatimonadetes bacterium]|nr:biosynthetic-type acetolactate synthase large subunit [Armatimonadota bacterium]
MNQRSGAKIVMESLVRQGVDTLFGYPGGVVLPLYDEMLNWPQVKHVLVRHEQCAAHMADGYARSTGKVGVCLATSGPGATNLVTGIATAMMDSIPMVALTGNVNSWAIGTDAFQETDIQGITIPITKHNYLVQNVSDLPQVLEEAFYLANSGRKGPVLVDIPKDVFIATTDAPFPDKVGRRGYRPAADINPLSFERAARLLKEAERPIVIAGAGVIWSDTSEILRQLAEKCDLPVISTLLGLGNVDRNDSRSLGMMGMHGEYTGTRAVQEADLIIGIGIRWDDRLTGKVSGFAPKAKIIHFDIDYSEFSKIVTTEVVVPGDLSISLPEFLANVAPKKNPEWWGMIREWQRANPIVIPDSKKFVARHVLDKLNELSNSDAYVSTDVGQHQMWTAQVYKFRRPYQMMTSGGLGTMGFGFPAAMGAAFAHPGEEVWAVVGDGGFQMTLQELQTAVENHLDIKICLINNGFLGMVRQWQELFYDNRYSHVSMGNPDYAKLAEAYGVTFFRCSSRAEVESTIEKARAAKGPVLCEFLVEMEENVFPMVAAGASNDNIITDPALSQPAMAEATQ